MQELVLAPIGLKWKKCNMTMQTGIVEQVSTKEVNTKFGPKPTYSMKIAGTWIKCGFKDPGVQPGYDVEFDGVSGTYGVETKAVKILSRSAATVTVTSSATAPQAAAAPKAAYSSGYNKIFPIPALHGDRAIVRQNALARATDLYIAARGQKPFELEVTTLDLVIAFARKFEAYTAGDLDMAEAMKENLEAVPPETTT
jgi:hypothetical protein